LSRASDDLHEVPVRITEVQALLAAVARIRLAGPLAGRVGVVGNAAITDPREGGRVFRAAYQECVVVVFDVLGLVGVGGDPVGQGDRGEVRDGRADLDTQEIGEELRGRLRVVRGDDGVVQFDSHCWLPLAMDSSGSRYQVAFGAPAMPAPARLPA